MVIAGRMKLLVRNTRRLLLSLIEVADPAKFFRVILFGIEVLGRDNLVALDAGGFVDGLGVEAFEPEVVFGPDDEEGPCLMDRMKSGKIEIAPIHDVDGPCFDDAAGRGCSLREPSRG